MVSAVRGVVALLTICVNVVRAGIPIDRVWGFSIHVTPFTHLPVRWFLVMVIPKPVSLGTEKALIANVVIPLHRHVLLNSSCIGKNVGRQNVLVAV